MVPPCSCPLSVAGLCCSSLLRVTIVYRPIMGRGTASSMVPRGPTILPWTVCKRKETMHVGGIVAGQHLATRTVYSTERVWPTRLFRVGETLTWHSSRYLRSMLIAPWLSRCRSASCIRFPAHTKPFTWSSSTLP